jgi:cation transport ATPase
VIQAAESGFCIADPRALDTLAEAEVWIFDDTVRWTAPMQDRAQFLGQLRDRGVKEVIFLPHRGAHPASLELAKELGFTVSHSTETMHAKTGLITQRQFIGQSVVYFGDCTQEPEVAKQADLAISVLDTFRAPESTGPIALLSPDFARCNLLYSLSQARRLSVSDAFTTSLTPNLVAIAGAIFLNFSVLTSVALTNLGTLGSYYRWRQKLRSAL